MTNAVSIIRSLIIYGLCLPLAVFLGYLLAMPMDMGSFVVVVVALALPLVPVLLRWHHPLLVLSWNVSMVLFFLPGRPNLWMAMTAVSLSLSILQHILNRNMRFLHVPSVARPLFFLLVVILVTAQMTGGIGLKSLGGESYGGKKYIYLFGAIAGYFAFTARAVPPAHAVTYVALFFLGNLTSIIGNLVGVISPSFYFIFALFPVEKLTGIAEGGPTSEVFTRLGGVTIAAQALLWFMLARHGLRSLLDISEAWRFFPFRFRGGLAINQPWRLLACLLAIWVVLLGGYRSFAIIMAGTLLGVFYLERLFRTHLLPILVLLGLLAMGVGLPLVDRLPLTIQRSLSFLPLQIDPVARASAEASSEWRLRIWREVIPTIPQYLLLGKGYSINAAELEMARSTSAFTRSDAGEGTALAGDYHNGPLSLIIPFGIFGVIGFVWFLAAGFRVLLNNYRHGDPELRSINTFLLAYFAARVIFFFTIYGALEADLVAFAGLLGLSVSLNGGVRRPAPTVPGAKSAFNQFRLARPVKS